MATKKSKKPVRAASSVTKSKTRSKRTGRPLTTSPTLPDSYLPSGPRIANNLLEAVGGREVFTGILEDSSHPKAQALLDRMRSSLYLKENFAVSYSAVGLKAADVLEIIGDVQQAKTFIAAFMEADEVMRSLIRAAKDQIEPHVRCKVTGRVLDPKTKQPTSEECVECRGSGYILKSGDRASQELYFELLNWKKSGGMISIDARRQNLNFGNQVGQLNGTLPGQPPSVQSLIQRADQLALPAAQDGEHSEHADSHTQLDRMPEDMFEEAEVV